MKKSEKHLRAWRSGAKNDVPGEAVKLVLDDFGFSIRQDGGNHWLAYHDGIRNNPHFPIGRFRINAHYKRQGVVHPSAINDVLRAVDHRRELDHD